MIEKGEKEKWIMGNFGQKWFDEVKGNLRYNSIRYVRQKKRKTAKGIDNLVIGAVHIVDGE